MYKVYCDFDATVSVNDVWNELFTHFGKPQAFEVWKEFNAGTMRAAECIRIACSTVNGADVEAVEQLFREQPLRDGFVEFTQFCNLNALDLRIVSDGFSCYIRTILDHNHLTVPFWTNHIELTDSGNLSIDFRHQRDSCRHCASCKCSHLLTSSSESDTIVYIGDGYSDVCPVRMADVVFARDSLLRYCSTHGIPHHPFHDFHEIQSILSTYLRERPKYRREQAHRRRNELIMIE